MRLILLFLVLILLAGATLFFFRPDLAKVDYLAPLPSHSDPPAPEAASRDLSPTRLPALSKAPVMDLLALIPQEPVFRILVVAEESGEPLPGAEVSWRCSQEQAALLHPSPEGSSPLPDGDASAAGYELIADAQGAVSLPRLPWKILVSGRHDHRFGQAEFDPGQPSPTRLVLHAARQVEIQVVDANGVPQAGVPVALLAGLSPVIAPWRGRSAGLEGKALARFLPGRLGKKPSERDIVAVFQLPITPAEPVPVSFEDPRPVRLVLPPTGAIRVSLLDRTGLPFTGRVELFLRPSDEHGLFGPAEQESWPRAEGFWTAKALATEGTAFFPLVGLERKWELTARSVDLAQPWENRGTFTHGPSRPGEVVQVVLSPENYPGPFRGRMVDQAGRPLEGILVCAWVDRTRGENCYEGRSPMLFQTGDQGRFIFHPFIWTEHEGVAYELRFRFTGWQSTGPGGEPLGPWASVLAKPPFAAEGTELGSIVLSGEVPLVAGVVLDAQDRQVPATVYLRRHPPGRLGPGEDAGPWQKSTATDAEGRFFFPVHDTGPMEAWAVKGGARSGFSPVLPGTTDLVLRLPPDPRGSLEFEVLFDPGIPVNDLGINVVQEDPEVSHGGVEWDQILPGELRCRRPNLDPGVYRIEVSALGSRLAWIEGIRVEAGQTARDPRVSPLDLRGRLRVFALRARTSDGAALEDLTCAFEAPGLGVKAAYSKGSVSGQFRILVPAEVVEIQAGSWGYRPVRLAWSPETQDVLLRPGPRVRLREVPGYPFEPHRPGLAGLADLSLDWQRVGSGESGAEEKLIEWTGGRGGSCLEGGTPLLALSAPGLYRFRVEVQLVAASRRVFWVALPKSSPGEIEIRDQEAEQFLDLRFDATELLEVRRNAAEKEPR